MYIEDSDQTPAMGMIYRELDHMGVTEHPDLSGFGLDSNTEAVLACYLNRLGRSYHSWLSAVIRNTCTDFLSSIERIESNNAGGKPEFNHNSESVDFNVETAEHMQRVLLHIRVTNRNEKTRIILGSFSNYLRKNGRLSQKQLSVIRKVYGQLDVRTPEIEVWLNSLGCATEPSIF